MSKKQNEVPATKLVNLDVTKIVPSDRNPRKLTGFDETTIKELADSIREQGLLQPVTVRPIADGMYEIVCGARRYRAVSSLDWPTIPAIVRELTDDEALDAMITENLQRKDVDPIEESDAFCLLQQQGKSVEELAARFGKSERYIRDRISLTGLTASLAQALRADRLTLSAALKLTRLNREQQDAFCMQYLNDEDIASVGVTEVNDYINEESTELKRQLFLDDNMKEEWLDCQTFNFPRCENCPCNSASQTSLFPEMSEDVVCLDSECLRRKQYAYQDWFLDMYVLPSAISKGQEPQPGDLVIAKGYPGYGQAEKRWNQLIEKLKGYEFVDEHKYCYVSKGHEDDTCIRILNLGDLMRGNKPINYYRAYKAGKSDEQRKWEIRNSLTNLRIKQEQDVCKILQPMFNEQFKFENNRDWVTDKVWNVVVATCLYRCISCTGLEYIKLPQGEDMTASLLEWVRQHSFADLVAVVAVDTASQGWSYSQKAPLLEYMMRSLEPEKTEAALKETLDKCNARRAKLTAELEKLQKQKSDE